MRKKDKEKLLQALLSKLTPSPIGVYSCSRASEENKMFLKIINLRIDLEKNLSTRSSSLWLTCASRGVHSSIHVQNKSAGKRRVTVSIKDLVMEGQ